MNFNMNRIIGFFLAGLAIFLPLAFTVWLIYYVIDLLSRYFSFYSGFVALLLVVGLILALGYLATSFLGGQIWEQTESIFLKTPVLGLVYKSVKEITVAFVGTENKFSEPVLVKFTDEDIYKIGFVTNKEASRLLAELEEPIEGEQLYAVYFPLSFSLSGDLYLVPKKRLLPVNQKAKVVLQSIVSGGIIKME